MKRSILNILLGVKKQNVENSEIEYIRILGFNKKGREHLHKLIKQDKKQNIFTNWKDIEKINSEKIKIEKTGFLIKELVLQKREKLNSVIKER